MNMIVNINMNVNHMNVNIVIGMNMNYMCWVSCGDHNMVRDTDRDGHGTVTGTAD